MARNRVVYFRRNSVALNYDTALTAHFRARGWVVDELYLAGYADFPEIASEYWDDVLCVVMGPEGASGTTYSHLYQADRLLAVRAPIVAMERAVAYLVGIGSGGGSSTVSAFTRTASGYNPDLAIFSSVALTSGYVNRLTSVYTGSTFDYWAFSVSYPIVATRNRTADGATYRDVFFGAFYPALWSSDASNLFSLYTGGTDTSPREARVSLPPVIGALSASGRCDTWGHAQVPSPLTYPTGLVYQRRYARGAVRSPMEIPGGLTRGVVAAPSLARTALRTPLGMRTARARVRPAGVAALPTPLGALAGLTGVGVHARSALGAPLSVFRARAGQPRAVPAPALPQTRPRLLADPLPLRRGTDLPEYRTDAYLPWVYGRVTLAPLPLDAAGLEWLLADHPILAVTSVRDGEAPVSGWALEQRLDATGHPIAVLRLARKPEGALAATVSARRHAKTGALLEHPADIVEDLCSRCGIARGNVFPLRAGWPGVALGGVLADAMPLREAIAAVIGAVGARWSGSPLRAWAPDTGAVVATIDARAADDASADADTQGLATRLTVSWGWDWAANAPRGAVVVEAPDAIARYGEIAAELSAPWLRTARDALALAHAELARRARPTWRIDVQTGPRTDRLRPGDRVEIDHPWLPAGPAEITHIAASSISQRITCERQAGPVPRTQTVRRGELLDADADEPVGVSYRDGVATFTILDELGAPLPGATVRLDDAQTGYTDRQGRVQFRTARGAHTLEVTSTGYAPILLEVAV